MAMPIGIEDLKKLKSFIDFVANNPTILNAPQLSFVKQFIEKFGGKVPIGEYKIPEEGGCPFGSGAAAGVKPEPKRMEPESDSEQEGLQVETDPESDLELDMEVTFAAEKEGDDLYSTNSIYIQDPTDLKRNYKSRKSGSPSLSEDSLTNDSEKSREVPIDDEAYDMDIMYESCDESDPIDTAAADVIIKTESDFEDYDNMVEGDKSSDCNANKTDCSGVESDDSLDPDDLDYADELNGSENQDVSDIEETFKKIKPTQIRNRRRNTRQSRSSASYYKKKKKQPKPVNCTEKCKHKCGLQKITEAQRKFMCAEYWSRTPADRRNYLLKFVESRHISKVKAKRSNRPSRGYTNAYYLINREGTKVRVCLNYFQRTFCITSYTIKLATQNRDYKEIQKKVKIVKNGPKKNIQSIHPSPSTQEEQGNNKDSVASSVSTNVSPGNDQVPQPKQKLTKKRDRTVKRQRAPQPVNCDEACIMKCTKHFTAEQRSQICQQFWTMDFKRQKDFVLSKIETRDVESLTAKEYRTSTRAQRTFSNRYYFKGARGNNIRVCAKFFMATLCIGRHVINNAIQFADQQTGSYAGEDRRGRHTPGNKIPDELVQDVKRYIESFPTWVPHKSYKTRFLHSSLSIQQMWRDYKSIREADGRKYCSASFFRQVFHKDYRLGFLKPNSKTAQRMNVTAKKLYANDVVPPNKNNKNVSDFTGEEGGGFWLEPPKNHERSTLRYHSPFKMAAPTEARTVADEGRQDGCYLGTSEEDVQRLQGQESAMLEEDNNANANDYDYSDKSCVQPAVSDRPQTHGATNLYIYNTRYDEEQPRMFQTL